jgi:hypothetical protein
MGRFQNQSQERLGYQIGAQQSTLIDCVRNCAQGSLYYAASLSHNMVASATLGAVEYQAIALDETTKAWPYGNIKGRHWDSARAFSILI